MKLNADFSQTVLIHTDQLEWQPSPMAGVERRMLDRVGDEVARATSIVRYAPGSQFSAHTHSGGEEFFVLDGVFQDEHGDFTAGTYVRNPPTSSHTPGSEQGCTILVKLWQFDPQDRTHVRIDTTKNFAVPVAGREGVAVMPLFQDARESVAVEVWQPNATVALDFPDGAELFVLQGGCSVGDAVGGPLEADALEVNSWLRLPHKTNTTAQVGNEGAKVWIKTGHLRETTVAAPG